MLKNININIFITNQVKDLGTKSTTWKDKLSNIATILQG